MEINNTFLVGTMILELDIPGSFSLKDKRKVLNSLKTQIKNKFNVSISEIGEKDIWNRSVIGIATISDNKRFVDEILQKVLTFIDNFPSLNILQIHEEIL